MYLQEHFPTVVRPMQGVSDLSLNIPGVGDLDAFLAKAQKVIDSAPAAMAAVPGIQKNTEFIQAAIPPIVGAILLLVIVIVVNK